MTGHPSKFGDKSIRILLFLVLIVVGISLSRYLGFTEEGARNLLDRVPAGCTGIIFVLAYITFSSLIWIGPKDVLRVVGAAVFGAWWSTLWVFLGEMGCAVIMFLISRHLGREYVAGKLKGNLEKIDQAVSTSSYWWIFLFRAFIIVPLRFLDLGFGLTGISLRKYILICAIGTPIRIFAVQFFLALGLDTVSNPQVFADYLVSHPQVFLFGGIYIAASFVMIFVLKKRSRFLI